MTTNADAQTQGPAAPAPITTETIRREHPQVHAAIFAAGAAAERERVTAVRAQTLPGHEKLIEALVADGKTTGPEAAMAVLAAERGAVEAAAKAHAADSPKAAKNSAAPAEGGDQKTREQQAAEATAYAAANKVDFMTACAALGINS